MGEIPGETPGQAGGGDIVLDITYTEALEIDYRWFDAKNITPRFEFGFGMSYTTFEYSNLNIEKITTSIGEEQDDENRWEAGQPSRIAVGSSTAIWLHRPAYNVTFDVKNTGSVYGGDIPQLYVHHPASAGEPPSVLKGFTHIEILPGQTKTVHITLSRYDLSIWDVVGQGWKKPDGTIEFSVSRSSRDVKLHGSIPA